MDDQQQLFCARLKAAREQKGISLECIAASTKISVSVYEGLERNNLSGWPKGLYRRAYLRSYLTALGLPPEPIVQEFRELFPVEEDDAFLRAASPPTTDALATAAPERKSAGLAMPSWLRLLAGVFDMTKAAAAIAAVGRRFVKDTDGHARGTVVRIRIVR